MGSLGDTQRIFAHNISAFIQWIFSQGCSCTLGEAWRSPEQALLYAKQGKGIKNSLHCDRLAMDLNIFDAEEQWLTSVDELRPFGEHWKSMHPRNNWGGDFLTRPDSDHYSMGMGDSRK